MKQRFFLSILTICWSLSVLAARPDSISRNIEDYNYLTQFTENNLATFPFVNSQYGKEYARMKRSIRRRLLKGQDMESATCDYVYWFFSQFDTHFIVASHRFWNEYDPKVHTPYSKKMDYAPKAIACKVDSITFLVRIPSCSGSNPTFAWVASVAHAFRESQCPHLIIDVRGNTGGSDAIWVPFFEILADSIPDRPWRVLFRNTKENVSVIGNRGMDELASRAVKSDADFIPLSNDEDDETSFEENGFITKVAVIVDSRTASSAETIVRFVKDYCHRGQIFGNENTSGANLTGNVAPFQLPHSGITCYYPVCVDETFAEHVKTRQLGIKPDVRIPLPLPASLTDQIDSWVEWVADYFNGNNTMH